MRVSVLRTSFEPTCSSRRCSGVRVARLSEPISSQSVPCPAFGRPAYSPKASVVRTRPSAQKYTAVPAPATTTTSATTVHSTTHGHRRRRRRPPPVPGPCVLGGDQPPAALAPAPASPAPVMSA